MSPLPPERISWAVSQLAVRPGDRLLEVGCGTGIAMEIICQRLENGRITGVDRSATAIAAAERRIARHLRDGRARLTHAPLTAFTSPGEVFDKVFAINVNLFWLSPKRELRVIRELLAPRGRLHLFYEPPARDQLSRVLRSCTERLQLAGFVVTDVVDREPGCKPGIGIVAAAN